MNGVIVNTDSATEDPLLLIEDRAFFVQNRLWCCTRQILLTENEWNSLIPNSISPQTVIPYGFQFTTNPRRTKSLRIRYEKM